MRHSLDKGSPIAQAMAGTAQGNSVDAVRAKRIADERDYVRELRASELYEELRLLSRDALRERAGGEDFSRQQLITIIMEREVPRV